MGKLKGSLTGNLLRFIRKQLIRIKKTGAVVDRSNLLYKLHVYRCQ
jgi:hypothetical protein